VRTLRTDCGVPRCSNRAAAFIHLGKETKAIKDAEQAIELKPDWAKGYFRKGAALAALRKWDESIQMLEKALEVDPKSKEIATVLRETTRKRNAEKGEAKRAEGKGSGFKFDLSKSTSDTTKTAKDAPKDSIPVHIPAPQDTGREFVGCGTQSIVEQFLTNSLTSAVTQFASQGELKSVVYVQPATPGGELQVIGVEAGFDSPQANQQCCDFLRSYAIENKALAMIVLAEKRNVAYPQVWKGSKTKSQWKWSEKEHGIFMQLDALAVGAVNAVPERKVWFIPTGTNKLAPRPGEPVQLDIDLFAIMPPLLKAPNA
jgi:tetratricopeptide (TPR) repeat protein